MMKARGAPEAKGKKVNAHPLERDDVAGIRWEVYDPDYRVDYWHQLAPLPGTPPEMMGYKQDSHGISGVRDVNEVLAWAEANAAGRSFVVYAGYGSGDERGIIRVYGADPTRNV